MHLKKRGWDYADKSIKNKNSYELWFDLFSFDVCFGLFITRVSLKIFLLFPHKDLF